MEPKNIDPEELDKLKKLRELMDDYADSGDRARALSKKRKEEIEEEQNELKQIDDLSASIAAKKARTLNLQNKLNQSYGATVSIERQIVEAMVKQQAADQKITATKDSIRDMSAVLSQKQKSYLLDLQSGKITAANRRNRLTEIFQLREIIGEKRKILQAEEKTYGFYSKKLTALQRETVLQENAQANLNEEISGLQKVVQLEEQRSKELNAQHVAKKTAETIETNLFGDSREYGKIKNMITEIGKGGLRSWLALLNASLSRWKELDKAAGSFREKTGALVTQTKQIDDAARAANVRFAHMGVTLQAAYDAAEDLSKEFQVFGLVSSEAITESAKLSKNIGIATADTAKFSRMFESTARRAGTTSVSLAKAAGYLSDMAGVSPNIVMRDVANSSKETLTFLAKSPIQLIKAAIEARRLGSSLNEISTSSRGYLNYQQSITRELEASALLGRSVSFQESRMLTWQKKPIEARKAALRELAKYGDFADLDILQQEALASAAEMTVEEIIKAQNQEKMLQALQSERPELYKQMAEWQEKLGENEKNAQKDIVKQAEAWAEQQLRQSETNKMTNAMDSAWTNIKDALLPIANGIMPSIVTGTRMFANGVKIASASIKGVLSPFDAIFNKFRSGNKYALDIEKAMAKIGTATDYVAEKVASFFSIFSSAVTQGGVLLYTVKNIGRLFGKTGITVKEAFAPFTKLSDIFFNIADKIKIFSSRLSGMASIIKPIVSAAGRLARTFGVFFKFAGPIGLVVNALQLVWEFSKNIVNTWSDFFDGKIGLGEAIVKSLVAIPDAIYEVLVAPLINIGAAIIRFFGVNVPEGISDGIKSKSKEIFTSMSTPFVKTYEWAKENIMGKSPSKIGLGILEGIQSVSLRLYKSLVSPFQDVKTQILKIFDIDKELIGKIGNKILDGTRTIAPNLYKILINPFQEVTKRIPKMFDMGGELAEKIGSGVQSVGKTMAKNVGDVFKKLSGSVKSIENFALDAYKNISTSFFEIISPLTKDPISSVANASKGVINEFSKKLENLETEALTKIKKIKSSLGDVFEGVLADKTVSNILSKIKRIQTSIESILDSAFSDEAIRSVTNKVKVLQTSIKDILGDAISSNAVPDISKDIISGIKTKLSAVLNFINTKASSFAAALTKSLETSLEKLGEIVSLIKSEGRDMMRFLESMQTVDTGAKTEASSVMTELVKSAKAEIENSKIGLPQSFVDSFRDAAANILIIKENAFETMESVARKITNDTSSSSKLIYDMLEMAFGNFGKSVKESIGVMGSAIHGTLNNLSASVYSITNAMRESMASVFYNMESIALESYKKITDIAKNVFSVNGDVGKNMITGIVDINNAILTIFKNTFSAIADTSVAQIKNNIDVLKNAIQTVKISTNDITLKVGNEAQRRTEEPQVANVQVQNISELRETIDKLMAAISRIDTASATQPPIINIPDNTEAMVSKIQELIELLRDGAIAVNIDGVKASKLLARASV